MSKSQTVAIFERGKLYCEPELIRVFKTKEKAIEEVPEGFIWLDIENCHYYENKSINEWIQIKEYEVE